MSRVISTLVVTVTLLLAGCFRTRYVNLQPRLLLASPSAATAAPTPKPHSSWQSFFIWGWVPSQRVIPAAEICGGPESVKEIRTERTFVQGLIAMFAGYYINIYSPYDGLVVCEGDPVHE